MTARFLYGFTCSNKILCKSVIVGCFDLLNWPWLVVHVIIRLSTINPVAFVQMFEFPRLHADASITDTALPDDRASSAH